MKKVLFMSLAAAAMLTACSNDTEVAMPKQNGISFDGFVNKSTRATEDQTLATLRGEGKGFGVYGYMKNSSGRVFSNEHVTYNGSQWTYGNTQYWTAGENYWFFAIAPYISGIYTFTPAENIADGGTIKFVNALGNNDLIYAEQSVTNADPTTQAPVPFTFDHLLSRVMFQFKNAMGNENTSLRVTNVKITNAAREATYTTKTKTWTIAPDVQIVTSEFGAVPTNINNGGAGSTDHKFVIPRTDATFRLTFTVELLQGGVVAGTYNHSVNLPTTTLESRKSYLFTAELNAENIDPEGVLKPIEFDVTAVEEWEDFMPVVTPLPTPEP